MVIFISRYILLMVLMDCPIDDYSSGLSVIAFCKPSGERPLLQHRLLYNRYATVRQGRAVVIVRGTLQSGQWRKIAVTGWY